MTGSELEEWAGLERALIEKGSMRLSEYLGWSERNRIVDEVVPALVAEVRRLQGVVSAHEEVQRITGGLASHVEVRMLRQQMPTLFAEIRRLREFVGRTRDAIGLWDYLPAPDVDTPASEHVSNLFFKLFGEAYYLQDGREPEDED